MDKKAPKHISSNFAILSHPLFADPTLNSRLEERNNALYGAVFNALDAYLRNGYAFTIGPSELSTEYMMKGEEFHFVMKTRGQNDKSGEDVDDALQNFFGDISRIKDSEELTGLRIDHQYVQNNNVEYRHTLTISTKHELMLFVEELLKPYDFIDSNFSTFVHHELTDSSPLRFEMHPQYSLKHIDALLRRTQGQSIEGRGLYLSH